MIVLEHFFVKWLRWLTNFKGGKEVTFTTGKGWGANKANSRNRF